MLQPTILNAAMALVLMLGLITGLAWLARYFGPPSWFAPAWFARTGAARRGPAGRVSLALDRNRRLSIIEIEGWRFAVLTGGRSDQLLMLDAPASVEPR